MNIRNEIWAFSERELADPESCNSTDELVAYIDVDDDGDGSASFGIIVYRDGEVTDSYDSGMRGVPKEFKQLASVCETLTHPDGEDTKVRRNVAASDMGHFIKFTD